MSAAQAQAFWTLWRPDGAVHSHFIWRPQLRDAADEMVLEAAVNGQANGIVSFNHRDFADAPARFGLDLLLPATPSGGFVMTDTSTYPLRLPCSVKAAAEQSWPATKASASTNWWPRPWPRSWR